MPLAGREGAAQNFQSALGCPLRQPFLKIASSQSNQPRPESLHVFIRSLPLELNRNRPVRNCIREPADSTNDVRPKHTEVNNLDLAALPEQREAFPPLRCPAFSTPRRASEYSLSPRKAASLSSKSNVG